MKAAYLKGRMDIEVRDIPRPVLSPGGLIIKVDSTGLCGSDINRIRHTTSTENRVIGHEISGTVVEMDSVVTQFKIGDRVAVGHVHVPCMHCIYCRKGSPAMCRHFKETRVEPGGYAEYVSVLPDHIAHSILKIPESVTFPQATFIDPLGCVMRAVTLSRIGPFERAAVVGTGIMGMLFVQLLSQMNVESFILDISEHRLGLAREFGATKVFNTGNVNAEESIHQATDGQGVDVVFLTFLTQQILDDAMGYIRDGGTLVVFAPPIKELGLKLNYFDFFRREMRMVGSYSSVLEDIEVAMRWIESGKINVDRLITGYSNLENMLDTVARLDDRQLKIIIHP